MSDNKIYKVFHLSHGIRRISISAIACLLLLMTNPAQAVAPACINGVVNEVSPYGTATLKKLFFHVYDAEFWTDGNGWKENTSYALRLTYGVDIDKEDFLERTMDELKRQPSVNENMLDIFEQELTSIYPDVTDGDSITAVHPTGKGIIFCHNGEKIGEITNPALVKPFFGIWLGAHTSEPAIRDKLLKK